jgi:hypothetical protein
MKAPMTRPSGTDSSGGTAGFTPRHLEALQEALASGEQRVAYDGKSVEYRSVADLQAAIAQVQSALASQAGRVKTRQIRVLTAKGL